jgi:UMF1 family MFS transporter
MEPLVAKGSSRPIISWAFYDWANSAFATTIMAGFFPLFFKKYWSTDLSVVESTYYLGLINSASSFLLALTSPALGAIADEGSLRKKFLLIFTALGVFSSIGLGFIGHGEWQTAAWIYSIGLIGFAGANTFYDALLVQVCDPKKFDRISAMGYSLGYLGGGILFALNVWMYSSPQTFGFANGAAAIKASFITVGIWWALFSIPLFLWVKEWQGDRARSLTSAARSGFHILLQNIKDLRAHRGLLIFLIAYLFYIDGVNTIVKMAVDYGMSIGLEPSDLIKALLMVQFIGFPSAIGFGYLGEKMGAKLGIWICLIAYAGVTAFAFQMTSATEFYVMAAIIGLVQGGIQSLSRSYYARLVPPAEAAQYFGFFNMLGKFSSILGPLFIGVAALLTGSTRASILVLLLFFLIGGIMLALSHQEKAK